MIYLFLDTETTGINIEKDHIISFSYKICYDLDEIESGTIEMNPFKTLEEAQDPQYAKAFEVNGYKPEQIMTFIPAAEGMKKVKDVFQKALGLNNGWWPQVVGYNSNGFDLPIIKANAKRYGVELPNIGFKHVDVLQLIWALDAMGVMPTKKTADGRMMGNKLCESVEKMQIDADQTQFHGSAYDVEMTYQLFKKMKQTIKITL